MSKIVQSQVTSPIGKVQKPYLFGRFWCCDSAKLRQKLPAQLVSMEVQNILTSVTFDCSFDLVLLEALFAGQTRRHC